MGTFCPQCKTHQAIVLNVTRDGGPVSKDNPILARKLACGHTLSGAAHTDFIEQCNRIRAEAFDKKAAIDKQAEATMSAAWSKLTAKGGS